MQEGEVEDGDLLWIPLFLLPPLLLLVFHSFGLPVLSLYLSLHVCAYVIFFVHPPPPRVVPPVLFSGFLCPVSTEKRRLLLLWLVHAHGAQWWFLDVDGSRGGAQC